MRIAHADLVHVIERVADVVDARAADAYALRHEPRAPVQIELAHVGRMRRVGDERERAHGFSPDPDWNQARLVHSPRHLAVPEPGEGAAQPCRVDAIGHAPARTAATQAHHEAGLACRAAVARGEDAERAMVAMRAAERFMRVVEAGRPHQRAVAEYPKIAFG